MEKGLQKFRNLQAQVKKIRDKLGYKKMTKQEQNVYRLNQSAKGLRKAISDYKIDKFDIKDIQKIHQQIHKIKKEEDRKSVLVKTNAVLYKGDTKETLNKEVKIKLKGQVAYVYIWRDLIVESRNLINKKAYTLSKHTIEDYVTINYHTQTQFQQGIDDAHFAMLKSFEKGLYAAWIKEKGKKEHKMVTKQELKTYSSNPKFLKMFRTAPIDYVFLSGVDINETKDGICCVDYYLLKTYKPYIPTLTLEKLDEIMTNPHDMNVAYNAVFGSKGRDSSDIQRFCDKYKICHYALDMKYCLFHKQIYPRSNYPALIYYMANSHMYPVTDKATRQHITKSNAKGIENKKITSDMFLDESNDEKLIEIFKLESFEDVTIDKLSDYKDCNIFYHTGNMHDMFIELYQKQGKVYKTTIVGDQITIIHMEDKNVRLLANRNHTLHKDWNDVKRLCVLFEIPFKNQTYPALAKVIFDTLNVYGTSDYIRKSLTHLQREKIFESQKKKCANCETKCVTYEIDHHIPISRGGTNKIKNLRALCKECHSEKTKREYTDKVFKVDGMTSSYNKNTLKLFAKTKNTMKHTYGKRDKNKILFGLDINNCRGNIARYMKQKWPVLSILDDVVKFDRKLHKDIPHGFYYITTNNIIPFNGNGTYNSFLVRKALKANIISVENIKYYIKPSLSLPKNHFKSFINTIYTTCEADKDAKENKDAKCLVNPFIGSLGCKQITSKKITLTESINEASYYHFASKIDSFVVPYDTCEPKFYEVIERDKVDVTDSKTPIFNQILDIEAWEVYLMTKLIEKHGGTVYHVNTDAVIGQFDTYPSDLEEEMKQYYWDDEQMIPKYKKCTEIKQIFTMKPETVELDLGLDSEPQKIIEDPGHNKFKKFCKKLIKDNKSFEIDGPPGTGKSHLITTMMRQLKKKNINFITLCPTHKAAGVVRKMYAKHCEEDEDKQIEVATVDSFLGKMKLTPQKRSKLIKKVSQYEYIFVDEKSMMRELFYRVMFVIKESTKCKWIITGDWRQLPPVCDRCESFDYENSSVLKYLCDNTKVILTKCRRASDVLFNMVMNTDNVKFDDFKHRHQQRSLAYHNKQRIYVNHFWMKKHEDRKEHCLIKKYEQDQNSQDMLIYEGLPLIARTTEKIKKERICNGEEFNVVSFDSKTITVTDEERTFVIDKNKFSKLFYPAYCITIHKAQGVTWDKPYTIYEWDILSDTLKYVALSRGTDETLINLINSKDIDE